MENPTQLSLAGKVALITGAASGIGKRIAEVFADAGADIVVADINIDAANACVDKLLTRGVRALAIVMDVTDEASVDNGFDCVKQTLGPVDILVSNAGNQIIAPVVDFSFADWKKLMAVHLDGGFLTSRAAMRHMIAAGNGGSIIMMGSIHSKLASKLKAPYVAAKHGLEGLARAIAKEGAPNGIRSNVICPGFVRTPLVEKQIPEQAASLGISEEDVIQKVMLKDTVDGEFTTIDDVARTALTFAAWPTNALTGQSLLVSHGWHMQ